MNRKTVRINDISKNTETLSKVENDDLMKLPVALEEPEWKAVSANTKENFACILDNTAILPITRPKTKEEEDKLVHGFLSGMEKLFQKENNWTFLSQLVTTMDHCAKCNTCSEACHIFEASGYNEMYRPNYRTEVFRRIYNKYIKKGPGSLLSSWTTGYIDLTWQTVARLGELAYRCNLCRRCAQTCPVGVDNGLVAREIRKIFSQELNIARRSCTKKAP